jgi:hypothetical protein
MKTLFAAVALMAFGQAALATEPATAPAAGRLELTDTQMDTIVAGRFGANNGVGNGGFDGLNRGSFHGNDKIFMAKISDSR